MERQRRQRHRQRGHRRPALAYQQQDRADGGQHQHDARQRDAVPRPDERAQQRARQHAWRRMQVEHLDAGEVLARLGSERREVGVQPAAGDDERNAPRQAADGEGNRRPEQRAAEAAARAIHEHYGQERRRHPQRLGTESDGEAGEQRAQHDHPARSRHLFRVEPTLAAGGRVLPPPCQRQAGQGRTCGGQAGHVAHRAGAHVPGERTRAEDQRREHRAPRQRRRTGAMHAARRERTEGARHQPHEQQPAGERQRRQRARLHAIGTPVRPDQARDGRGDLAERDVDGVPRRMRTVRGRVEVAHAEREVHRVDVLECRRQCRQVTGGHAGEHEQQGPEGRAAGRDSGRRGGHEMGLSSSGSLRLPWR